MAILWFFIKFIVLIYIFRFIGEYIVMSFNKKYLYIHNIESKFRVKIYRIKKVFEVIVKIAIYFPMAYRVYSHSIIFNELKVLLYWYAIISGFINGILWEDDRKDKKTLFKWILNRLKKTDD